MKARTKILLSFILIVSMSVSGAALWQDIFQQQGHAAVIDLSGDITPSSPMFSSDGITPDRVRSLTTKAKDQGADAIIYEINSGGGAVVASKEVMNSIEAVDIPTVCRIRDIGASGAYMAALGCDRIVADEVSLTGSIGVTASYPEFSGLMNELGIEYINISSGRYKEAGSPFRNTTQEDREMLQEKSDTVHTHFIEIVDESRNLSSEQLEEASTGEAFLGTEAEKLGLVDELGGRETALKATEELTDQDLRVVEVRETPSFGLGSLLLSGISIKNMFGADTPFKSAY